MKKLTSVCPLVVAMALLATGPAPALAQKGKTTPPPDAVGKVTMADRPADALTSRPADALTSDGFGPYEGATLYGSGTLRLDLSTLPGRVLWIDLRAEDKTATASSVDHVTPGRYGSDAVLRIDTVTTAPANGDWMRSVGRIGFGQSLPNHALGFRYSTANGVPIYGTEVCVRRVVGVTPATWVIASSDACSPDLGQAGLFEEGLKGKGYQFEAVYKVRFSATVVCTSGPTCPQ